MRGRPPSTAERVALATGDPLLLLRVGVAAFATNVSVAPWAPKLSLVSTIHSFRSRESLSLRASRSRQLTIVEDPCSPGGGPTS